VEWSLPWYYAIAYCHGTHDYHGTHCRLQTYVVTTYVRARTYPVPLGLHEERKAALNYHKRGHFVVRSGRPLLCALVWTMAQLLSPPSLGADVGGGSERAQDEKLERTQQEPEVCAFAVLSFRFPSLSFLWRTVTVLAAARKSG
jgi:hypothetical protein